MAEQDHGSLAGTGLTTAGAGSYLQLLGERRGAVAVDRAVDAAVWSAALAEETGWSPRDAARLRETALLRETGALLLGSIGVDAALTALMLGEAIDDEQAEWIRHAAERWDGGGPIGLRGETIAEGGRLLAITMTWLDERRLREPAHATARCWAMAGAALWPAGVRALTRLRRT